MASTAFCVVPEPNCPVYVTPRLALPVSAKSMPASMIAASSAIGVPATEKALPVPKAMVENGVVSPKACCQPSMPRTFASVAPRLSGAEARRPSVVNVVSVVLLLLDRAAAAPRSVKPSVCRLT
ncbi:hypothetical protein D9M70_548500 [compost metagenome]